MINRNVFDELFVLELANNHWGDLDRGLRIIRDFSTVVRYHNVHAAIKLQFRDVETFINRDFRGRQDIRYIKKTVDTALPVADLATMVEEVRRNGCLRMATPFDERSVELCERLDVDLVKIASSDITDWVLLENVARTRKPVIVSTGGASLRDMDAMVTFFDNRHIPLAVNHCVSIYPSEDHELELNQIDFLRARYPGHTIGFSTHEYHDWTTSIQMAYAKGARTFERHVDIKTPDRPFSPYCSTPENVSEWFSAFKKAKSLCGGPGSDRRLLPPKEVAYLDALVRGAYATHDLEVGHALTDEDFYLAVPLQKGQLSCRELIRGEVLVRPLAKDAPLLIDHFDNPYSRSPELRASIEQRGLDGDAPGQVARMA